MRFSRALLVAGSVLGMLTLASPALATPDLTFSLSKYVGSGTPPAAPYGQVELTANGANVDVKVVLAALSGFVNTGAGDWLFFQLSNFLSTPTTINPAISVINIATAGSSSVLTSEKASLSGSTLNLLHSGGAGDWDIGVYCSSGCFSGGSKPDPGPLTFTVTNVTLANFTTNNRSYYFAADLCVSGYPAGGGCAGGNVTGNAVATGPGTPGTKKISEPVTIGLFGMGLLGLAARRKKIRA